MAQMAQRIQMVKTARGRFRAVEGQRQDLADAAASACSLRKRHPAYITNLSR